MTDTNQRPTSLPPARERNRGGLRALDWSLPPEAEEGWIDKIAVRVQGSATARTDEALREYFSFLNQGPSAFRLARPDRLFGAGHWAGNKYVMEVVGGTTISSGLFQAYAGPRGARLDLNLVLNPSRTLAHLLERYHPDEFARLDPWEFFSRADRVTGRGRSLDRNDNVLGNFEHVGGTVYRSRVARLARFLEQYERSLVQLIAGEFLPIEHGFTFREERGSLVGTDGPREVTLSFGSVSLLQCEVYWERSHPTALAFVRSYADRALAAARDVRVFTYDLPEDLSVEREEGALSVNMPLNPSQTMVLAVYAKFADRVRFEVRYAKDLPQPIRDAAPEGPGRLARLLDAARHDAHRRLRWAGMARLMAPAEPAGTSTLLDLIEAVDRATEGRPEARRGVLESLLVTGGVSCAEEDGAASWAVLRALQAAGVVEHISLLVREERRGGRRFALTSRYSDLPWQLTALVREQSSG